MRIPAMFALSLTVSMAVADEPPVTVPIQRLSTDYALIAAQATLEACRELGMNVAVAVVDRGGHVQVQLRDSLAMPLTLAISEQKAYAAMNFNAATSTMQDRFTSPFSPGKIDGIVLSAGALPIAAGGTILGAIGVSGAPSGEVDEQCAQAGIDAIIDDVEMEIDG